MRRRGCLREGLSLASRGRNSPSFCPFCDNKLYEFLSRTPRLAASKTGFAARKRKVVRTEILGISTGILAVFLRSTSRRRYMYIYAARKSLIVNASKKRETADAVSLFSLHKDTKFSSVLQVACPGYVKTKSGGAGSEKLILRA